MIFMRRPLARLGLTTLLVAAALASACGESTTNSTPATMGDAGSPDAGSDSAGNPSSDGGSQSSGGEGAAVANAGQAQGAAGEGVGGMDSGPRCDEATFAVDCPPLECNLVSGCKQHACQYTPLKVCVNRLAKGTFVGGILDAKQGDLTLHGNFTPFRYADGPVCQGTTCLTGGLAP